MDDEIKQLRAKLETLERQKKEEEERNRDPFRWLRVRIQLHEKQLAKLREPASHPERNAEAIYGQTRELECDKCVLEAILALQAEVKALADAVAKLQVERLMITPEDNSDSDSSFLIQL
jgi:hypothetical protein